MENPKIGITDLEHVGVGAEEVEDVFAVVLSVGEAVEHDDRAAVSHGCRADHVERLLGARGRHLGNHGRGGT